jgi:hypothetical protein
MSEVKSAVFSALADREDQSSRRAIHVFVVPVKLRGFSKCDAIGLVELEVHEELAAAETSKGQAPMAFAYELLKRAVRQKLNDNGNGVMSVVETLSTTDASVDKWFYAAGPKLRSLAMQAYGAVHNNEEADTESFLKSQTVRAV